MTRRRGGSRKKIFVTVGVAAALSVGGVVVAPFAAASETSRASDSSAWTQWLSFWRGGSAPATGGAGSSLPSFGNVGGSAVGGTGQADGSRLPSFGNLGSGESSSSSGSSRSSSSSSSSSSSGTRADASGCADVELVFARGSGELPGLGILGSPLSSGIKKKLSGKSFKATAVNYAAAISQTSAGPGATAMTNHIKSVAAKCSKTQFVIGGYSQGATVTSIAVGAKGSQILGRGSQIPSNLSNRIAAIVVFGNPLSGFGGTTLEKASSVYGARTKSACGSSDFICGGSRFATHTGSHLSYATNGAVAQAATFAAGKIK